MHSSILHINHLIQLYTWFNLPFYLEKLGIHQILIYCSLMLTPTHLPHTCVCACRGGCVFLAADPSSCLPLLISACTLSLPLWPSVFLSKQPALQSLYDLGWLNLGRLFILPQWSLSSLIISYHHCVPSDLYFKIQRTVWLNINCSLFCCL